jgi:hypothetical protein
VGNETRSLAIPRQIELCGIVVTVELDPTLHQRKGMIGEARYAEQKIIIDPTVAETDTTEEALYHELCHWVLFIMNEDELRNNERWVDSFAHILYQAIKSGNNYRSRDWHREETTMKQAAPKIVPLPTPEPLITFSAEMLEYAGWLQGKVNALVQAGPGCCTCERQCLKKIAELFSNEVSQLEREITRNIFA